MTLNNSNEAIIELRRERVAAMLCRKMTQRQIVAGLTELGIMNPETNAPYCLKTVHDDIKAIKREWRKLRDISADKWMEEELASLDNLEQSAWGAKDLALVLKIRESRRKLIGLDAPSKQEHTGKDGEPIKQEVSIDITGLSTGQLEALAASLKD